MKPHFHVSKLKLIIISLVILVFAVSVNFITKIIFFPDNIKLIEGSIHQLNFDLPIDATITPETIPVLNVNNKPVKDNIKVSLSDALTIGAEESGEAGMMLSAFGFNFKSVKLDILKDVEVVPCGLSVGVKIKTDGVMVLGTGTVNSETGESINPCEGLLKSGDLLLNANNQDISNKEDLMEIIKDSTDTIDFQVKRNGELINATIKPIKSKDNENKIGAWVRDCTQGIGTITYYNPQTNKFAALGHGILDVDTKKLISIKFGQIMRSDITDIKKGQKGIPGELIGEIKNGEILGNVQNNSAFGIFGFMDVSASSVFPGERLKIGSQDRVHVGPATIRSNIEGDRIDEFDVFIESVNKYSSDNTRGMIIRITDPKLLAKTGGIVQGMSGSPIIQDGKLIGAVTHVFIQDPSKGYGIFIENMLNQERNI